MLHTPQKSQNKTVPGDLINQVINIYQKGDIQTTLSLAQELIQTYPDNITLHNVLGLCFSYKGKTEQALLHFREALKLNPLDPTTYNNLGNILTDLQQYEEAQKLIQYAINIKPDFAEAHNNLGNVLKEQKDFEKAIPHYEKAVNINSNYFEAYNNLGFVFNKLKKYSESEKALKKAMELNPSDENTNVALCDLLTQLGKKDESILHLKRFLKITPESFLTSHTLAQLLHEKREIEGAITFYKLAIKANPKYLPSLNNLLGIYIEKGLYNQALKIFKKGLKFNKPQLDSQLGLSIFYYNVGRLFQLRGDFTLASEYFNKAIKKDPHFTDAIAKEYQLKQIMSSWERRKNLMPKLAKLGITGASTEPFPFFTFEDHPERQLLRVSKYALENYNIEPIPFDQKPKSMPDRLRIGYFSADFREHAVSYQIAKVLALHDRDKIEVYAYSFSQAADDMRKRIIGAVDHFKNVADMSDKDVVLLARKDKIDIAIDLMGYTGCSRTNIFALRAAPIQIYLWGAAMAANFIDYVIADNTIIPDRLKQYYPDKIIYLPHSYMPTDNTLEISDAVMKRKDMGLPENGFVFCCFNNNYKITPLEFDIWMRLLNKVEGSVLWLKNTNQWAKSNLQKEAVQRGVDPSRLIFTKMLPTNEHLARHKLADLFLDTFNFNAHSTASDALWAGLPIITKKGEQLTSRAAASMLKAVGLPEMITTTEKDYEELALKLATDTPLLSSIREKLANNRLSTPLFNTEKYTKDLEKAFEKVYTHYLNDKSPKNIWV